MIKSPTAGPDSRLLASPNAQGPALAAVLGLAHLVVDTSSNFVVMLLLPPATPFDVMWLLVAYNFGAFALQPVVGLVTDRLRRPRAVMCLGLLLAAAAMLALGESFWVPLVLTSVGNALFHVGGGILASEATRDRASGPGIFIAPGAVGVVLGIAAGQSFPAALWPIFGGLLFFAVLGALLPMPNEAPARPTTSSAAQEGAAIILLLLLLATAIRSLLGLRVVGELKLHEGWALPLAVAAFSGKALGGVVADWVGWKRTAVVSLLLSSALLALADRGAWVAALALLFFQVVTSITLVAIYRVLPGRIGLGFGLACLALFLGGLPLLVRFDFSVFQSVPLNSLLALASVAAVWRALWLLERPSAAAQVPGAPSLTTQP